MSLYKRLHEQQGNGAGPVNKRRDPVLDELRQKIHHHLINELGPILYDKRLSEEDLRRRVQEQLQAAIPDHAFVNPATAMQGSFIVTQNGPTDVTPPTQGVTVTYVRVPTPTPRPPGPNNLYLPLDNDQQ